MGLKWPRPIKSYKQAHSRGKQHLKQRPYIIPILGLVLGVCVAISIWLGHSSGQTFRPSDAHIVFLFDSGRRQVLDTKAKTVGELVDRLNLHLIDQDVVEPARDTPIVEDNFRINIYHARPVTVLDGVSKTVTLTAQRSPRVVAQNAGLKVNAEDIAKFTPGNLKENVIGEQVLVSRATPVLLNLYGTQVATYTQAKTIAGLLAEKHIQLNNSENVNPATTTPITPNLQVFILSKGSQVITAEESVPAPTQTVSDISLSFGTTVVRQAGAPGKKLVTYLITTQKGVETARKLIQEAVIQAPVPQIIAKGTTIDINGDKSGIMAAAGIRSSDYAYVNYIVSRESGWCPTKAQGEVGYCPAYHGVPAYGGYGLGQATPGSKMATAGADWATNPITQLKWCTGYAQTRYGSWGAAYNHWLAYHNW
ncbi:MAG TPA: G5 domain-containing protein [Candidatus Saccharimonadales bacterium]|nr:G5 domain-containing protein [Candidatus Saccharimonadales bacterium]